MRRLILYIVIALLGSASVAHAAGWHDYELPVTDKYKIVRANSLQVSLCRSDGEILIDPMDHADVGPIVKYAVTPDYIFTHHAGRKQRNKFPDDTFEEIDPAKDFYFLVRRPDGRVTGPMSQAMFASHMATPSASSIQWLEPENPNAILPALGSAYFLFVSALMFGIPAMIVIGLLIAIGVSIILVVRRVVRRSRRRRAQIAD